MKLRLFEPMGWPTRRALRLLGATFLALGLSLGLSGCGPGTGGTGTGYSTNTTPAVNAQWFQGLWRSSALAEDGTTPAVPAAPEAPACVSPGPTSCAISTVLLEARAAGIEVQAACWTFTYNGSLGEAVRSDLRVTGLYTAAVATGAASTLTADLLLETRGADVVLTVFDAGGRVLQGPVVLIRSPGGAEAQPASNECAGNQGVVVSG